MQGGACLKRPWPSPFLSYWPWTPCPPPFSYGQHEVSSARRERVPALRWVLSSPALMQPASLPCCPLPMTRSLLSELRISADLINTKENLYIFQKQLSSRLSSPQKPLPGADPVHPASLHASTSCPSPPSSWGLTLHSAGGPLPFLPPLASRIPPRCPAELL